MKKKFIVVLAILTAIFILSGRTYADQVKVNIVYPIANASYPITDLASDTIRSAYFTASFSVTCKGGHTVTWGFDQKPLGKSSFIDQISIQFVHKLSRGDHVFTVTTDDCGGNAVKFKIGR